MLHIHGNIPYIFYFWTDPFVNLVLLKSSMLQFILFQLVGAHHHRVAADGAGVVREF